MKMPKRLPKICKTIVLILNTGFLLLSVGVLGGGGFLKFAGTIPLPDVALLDDVDMDTFNLGILPDVIASISIVLGLCGAVIAFIGILSAKKELVALSVTSSIITGVAFLAEAPILVIFLVSRNIIDGLVKTPLLDSITEYYRGYNGTNAVTRTWNFIMLKFSCCGVDDYEDFDGALHWDRRLFQEGWWLTLQTPLTCCYLDNKPVDDYSCAVNPTEDTSNFEWGCYDALWSYVDDNQYSVAGIIVLIILHFILSIASIILTRDRYIQQRMKIKTPSSTNEESTSGDEHAALDTRVSTVVKNGCQNLSMRLSDHPFSALQNCIVPPSMRPLLNSFGMGNREFNNVPSNIADYYMPRFHGMPMHSPFPDFAPFGVFNAGPNNITETPFSSAPFVMPLPGRPPLTRNSSRQSMRSAHVLQHVSEDEEASEALSEPGTPDLVTNVNPSDQRFINLIKGTKVRDKINKHNEGDTNKTDDLTSDDHEISEEENNVENNKKSGKQSRRASCQSLNQSEAKKSKKANKKLNVDRRLSGDSRSGSEYVVLMPNDGFRNARSSILRPSTVSIVELDV